MNKENTLYLFQKYPKIFIGRYQPITQSLMPFGCECGDGWLTILDCLCGNIQHHVDSGRERRAWALKWNRKIKKAIATNTLRQFLEEQYKNYNHQHREEQIIKGLENPEALLRDVPEKVYQVVATQVKEKFGSLRFYHNGGDDYVYGVISMAESMSAHTCEDCGKPGLMRDSGWIRCLCDEHAKEN